MFFPFYWHCVSWILSEIFIEIHQQIFFEFKSRFNAIIKQSLSKKISFFGIGLICRPAVISIPYLVLLFYAPFLKYDSTSNFYNRVKWFSKLIITATSINLVLQIILQILLWSNGVDSMDTFGFWGHFLQNIGLTELFDSK